MFTNTHLRLMLWKNACQFGGARNAYGLGNYPLASSRYPYIGPRKPRYRGASGPGRSTTKTPVFCAVERQGELRRRIVADVTAATLQAAICEEVDSRARIMTDEYSAYRGLKKRGKAVMILYAIAPTNTLAAMFM